MILEGFKAAKLIANNANCMKAKVGCVITDNKGSILSAGYNKGPCIGKDCLAYTHSCISCGTIHAEIAAVNNLSSNQEPYFAFVTKQPCKKCEEALKESGVQAICYLTENFNAISN